MIYVGQKFMSFDEAKKAIEEYENANNVKFMKLSSHMLKPEDKSCNESLVYKSIRFHCVRGGRFKRRGQGLRSRKTMKQDCPAEINLVLSNDKSCLEVKSIETDHNHELSERWVYFKDGISKTMRRKFKLQGSNIRKTIFQMDGHVNLQSALVENKVLEALQNKVNPDQEALPATESLCTGEQFGTENDILEFPGKRCSEEKKALFETQKSILNTLDHLNKNIQTLATNMMSITTTIDNLNASLRSITHIVLPDVQQ